jgi:hypothetical protein
MSDFGRLDPVELDNHITGHYGEDQFKDDDPDEESGFPCGIVPEVNLIGSDGNAFYVLGKCRREAIRAGVPTTEIVDFCDEAMSGNYDKLLATTMRYFEVN